jgi:hypothetical protein
MRKFLPATALGLAAVLAIAAPASAKGPRSATIEAPGIATPIEADWSTDQDAFGALVERSALWAAASPDGPGAPVGDRPVIRRPTGDLGPELCITWDVPGLGGHQTGITALTGAPDPDAEDLAPPDTQVHLLYPWAEGGPASFVAAGQATYSGVLTEDTWFRLEPELLDALADLGVPDRAVLDRAAHEAEAAGLAAAAGAAGTGAAGTGGAAGDDGLPVGLLAGGGLLLAAAAGGAVLVRGRIRSETGSGAGSEVGPGAGPDVSPTATA